MAGYGRFGCQWVKTANLLEGRCCEATCSKRGVSTLLGSKEVTMATEPQSASRAPVNTSLGKTTVWNVYLFLTRGDSCAEIKIDCKLETDADTKLITIVQLYSKL